MSEPAELNGADVYDLLIKRADVSDRMRRSVDDRIREQSEQEAAAPDRSGPLSSAG